MKTILLYSLIMLWILNASNSQQYYNPMGRATTDHVHSPDPDEHPYTTTITSVSNTAASTSTADTRGTGDTAAPSPSYSSMHALLDAPASGNLDPVTYQDYYDSIPYYDILDYFYIEENIDSNNDNTSKTNTGNVSRKGQPTLRPMMVTGSSTHHPQTSHDLNSISTTDGDLVTTGCDVVTHLGCDVVKFERCDSVTQTCRCVRGYLRATRPTKGPAACTAAKFLHGQVNLPMANTKIKSLSSKAVRIVQDKLWDYIEYSTKNSNVRNTVLDLTMRTSGIRSIENPSMLTLTYEVALQNNTSSSVMEHLRTIFLDDLQGTCNKTGPPEELMKMIGQMITPNCSSHHADVFSPLVEILPCSIPEHTYCSQDAGCRVQNGSHSHTCGCLPGFLDVSPDPRRFPGEVCEEQCQCENRGVCVASLDDFKVKKCSCVGWYFGLRCQVNGKELLIISVVCLACVVLIVTMVCCFCQARVRHRNRHTESSLFRFTPDTSILKLPRVWMEAHYPDTDGDTTIEKEFSPPSVRRMSIATECNPYFDGYILEDVPASCIQSDRSADTQSPRREATIGTIRGAATISSHSIFRHY